MAAIDQEAIQSFTRDVIEANTRAVLQKRRFEEEANRTIEQFSSLNAESARDCCNSIVTQLKELKAGIVNEEATSKIRVLQETYLSSKTSTQSPVSHQDAGASHLIVGSLEWFTQETREVNERAVLRILDLEKDAKRTTTEWSGLSAHGAKDCYEGLVRALRDIRTSEIDN